jgi:hypothetical protein
VKLPVGRGGVKADCERSAGGGTLPGRIFCLERLLGAVQQDPHEREGLYGWLRWTGVGASAVAYELGPTAVVRVDDVELLVATGAHRERGVVVAGLKRRQAQ